MNTDRAFKVPSRRSIPIVCWETGEVFESARDAGDAKGISSPGNIYAAIKNKTKCGGFHWYWADESKPESFVSKKSPATTKRPVVCWETGVLFENTEVAAAAASVTPSYIKAAIERKGTSGGYHWYWADEPRPNAAEFLGAPISKGRPKRAVVCWETGEVFASAREAAEAVGIKSSGGICTAIRKKTTSGGLHWYYQDQPKPDESELKQTQAERQRAVVCIETGETYPSIREAARTINQNATNISKALKDGVAVNGCHWKEKLDQE